MKRLLFAGIVFALLGCAGSPVSAADTPTSELRVAPSRRAITMPSSSVKTSTLSIANESSKPLVVHAYVKQFTVDDDTDTPKFLDPSYDWITFDKQHFSLLPGERTSTDYTISVPARAASGEYYFALFASAPTEENDSTRTIQVASLLYLYVDGSTVERASSVKATSIPAVTFGGVIPVSYDIRNTGNVHIQAEPIVKRASFGGASDQIRDDLLVVLPEHSRQVRTALRAPFFPGIYSIEYGFVDDVTQKPTTSTSYTLYIPLWSVAVLVMIVLATLRFRQRRRNEKQDQV